MSIRIPIPPGSEALEPLLPWIADWLEARESVAPRSEVEILKHSALRLVLRVPHPDQGSFILKLYRRKGPVEALRSLWLRSRSLREKKVLDQAAQRQIPCPAVLDAGHSPGLMPKLGWLFLQDLGEGQDLDQIQREHGLSEPDLSACADLLHHAWNQGLRHRDLHLGNFYRKKDGSLFLLDLHSAAFLAPAQTASGASQGADLGTASGEGTRAPAASDFRPLYLSFPWPEQRSQRKCLFFRLALPVDPPGLKVWRRTWLEHRLERCLRDSGSFYWRNSMGQTRENLFSTAELLEAIASAKTLKEGRRGSVLRSPLGIHKIRKSGRSLQLWMASEALHLRGIPHPRAQAWVPIRGGKGSILCEDLGAAKPLGETSTDEAQALANDLGWSFGRLHGSGWRFRDARGDNFLVRDQRVHFVDLDGCSPLPGFRSDGACSSDLGRLLAWLDYQAPTHLREQGGLLGRHFLRSYLRERRALDGEPRSLHSFCRQIALRSQAWRKSHE